MGNQQGAQPYHNYQPQTSQVGGQSLPYANVLNSWSNQAMTPSTINSMYQQGYPSLKLPSFSKVTSQPNQYLQQNYIDPNSAQQSSFRNSQLNAKAGTPVHAKNPEQKQIPSILQHRNHPSQSPMLRTNRSSSKQKKISFTDQVPRSVQMMRANMKSARQKLDKLANTNEAELYGIMEEIDSQVNQGIPSKDALIYLLTLKKKYEDTIISIRMKQQKLAKINSEIGAKSEPEMVETCEGLETLDREIKVFELAINSNWREALKTENSLEFSEIMVEGRRDGEVMQQFGTYQAYVQAAFSRLPGGLATSSVRPIMNSIENYQGEYPRSPTQSFIGQSQTARFNNSDINTNTINSSVQSNRSSDLYKCQINTQPPLSPINDSATLLPRKQTPQLADYSQSTMIPAPPQMSVFTPLYFPTANSFRV